MKVKLFGYEITIVKANNVKSVNSVSDNELMNMAIDKYLKNEITIMGAFGDVERGIIIGIKEILRDGDSRYVLFKTNNDEYPIIRISDKEIMKNHI